MSKAKAVEAKKPGAKKILTIVFIVFMCIALLAALFYSTGLFQKLFAAVTVDNYKLNAVDYNIFYTDARTSYLTNNSDRLASLGIDTNQNIDTQRCSISGFKTWKDFFRANALTNIKRTYTLYGEAEKDGYTMSNSVRSDMETSLYYMQIYAVYYYGYTNIDNYIASVYGSNVKFDDIKRIYEIQYTAQGYFREVLTEKFGITEQDLTAYYQEHTDDFDVFKYLGYTFRYETVTYTEGSDSNQATSADDAKEKTEANKQAAKDKADKLIAEVTDRASFMDLVNKYADDEQTYDKEEQLTGTTAIVSSVSTDIDKWCAEADRAEGDTNIFEVTNGYTVVYYIGRAISLDPTVSMRHILIKTTSVTDSMTDEQKAEAEKANEEAKAKIESIKQEYLSGEQSEEAFAALAKQYSEDNAEDGGLYSEFAKGTMVTEIDDWMFDTSRKAGDVEIIESEYGYHLVYFVGQGRPTWMISAEQYVANERLEAWLAEESSKHTLKTNDLVISLS